MAQANDKQLAKIAAELLPEEPAEETAGFDEHEFRKLLEGVFQSMGKLEDMVARSYKLPFADKVVVNDNDLSHYVDDLRRHLPTVIEQAKLVIKQQDEIIAGAEREAERIINDAKNYGEKLTNESKIVEEAKAKAKEVLQQSQEQERTIMERTQTNAMQLRNNAETYAQQVFDQLIRNVGNTFQGVQQAQTGLQQAMQVLEQARQQLTVTQPQAPAAPAAQAAQPQARPEGQAAPQPQQ